MKKIVFILPYFGKMPNYFRLFLNSCKYNAHFNWIIFTDDHSDYNYPSNVKVVYLSFSEMKKHIQNKFEFEICLDKPYKLCDFKPAYGYIFEEYISDYDFWGHCDCDLIFGDLGKFITKDILENHDKIFHFGHLTIYRNNEENNQRFKLPLNGEKIYRKAFSSKGAHIFDEGNKEGKNINAIYESYKFKHFTKQVCADVYTKSSSFDLITNDYNTSSDKVEKIRNSIFIFNHGKVQKITKKKQSLDVVEYAYIHLQKRRMKTNLTQVDYFSIIPHAFEDIEILTVGNFNSQRRKYFNFHYFRIRFNNLRVKIKNKYKKD